MVGTCWYSNNSGLWNSTHVVSGTNFTNVSSVEGSNTFTVYCNNGIGFENSSSVTFYMNMSPIANVVAINESGVVNGIVKRGGNLVINATISGATYVWVKVWQGAVGISAVVWQGFFKYVSGDLWSVTIPTNWTFSLGEVNYTVYANDSLGNVANFSSNFTMVQGSDLTECDNLDIPNSVYTLKSDIHSTGTCFNVMANNVTLNFSSYKITGDAYGPDLEYGINITNYNSTKIINGTVSNFTAGVYANNTNLLNISGGNYSGNGPTTDEVNTNNGYNIYITNSTNFNIENLISDNPHDSSDPFGSCPYVYLWNGVSYDMISDINGNGIMGLPDYTMTGVRGMYVPQSFDFIVVNESQMVLDNGNYNIRISQDPDEASYVDELELWTADHSKDTELYSSVYGFMGMNLTMNKTNYQLYTVKNKQLPVSFIGNDNVNLMNEISHEDGIYPVINGTDIYSNYTVNLGNLSNASRIKFVMRTRTLFDNAKGFSGPYANKVYIKKNGSWIGYDFVVPHGEWRTGVVDMTPYFSGADDYNVIFRFGYGSFYLDYFAIDTSIDEPVTINSYKPTLAELKRFGPGSAIFSGNATKLGNVLPLLSLLDDKFVVMTMGDYIDTEFSPVPALNNDSLRRDFIIYEDDYFKNNYAKFALNEQNDYITPLPFHEMSAYPYLPSENYPTDPEHNNYINEYNTRTIEPTGHYSAYSVYVDSSLYGTIKNVNGSAADATRTYGVYLQYTNYTKLDRIIMNDFANYGSYFYYSYFNNLSNCIENSNYMGTYTYYSNNNIFSNITANSNSYGAYIYYTNSSVFLSMNSSGNSYGVSVQYSSGNNISDSIFENNTQYGIYLAYSPSAILRTNNMSNNSYNFYLDGSSNQDFNISVDTTNFVEHTYKIYYNYSANNSDFGSIPDAGTIICAKCNNVSYSNMNLSSPNNYYGIYLFNTTNSNIRNVTSTKSYQGIYVYYSNYNNLTDITAFNNSQYGVRLYYSSFNNLTNIISNNNSYGLYVDSYSNSSTFRNITANLNSNRGIYLGSQADKNSFYDVTANSNNPSLYIYGDFNSFNNINVWNGTRWTDSSYQIHGGAVEIYGGYNYFKNLFINYSLSYGLYIEATDKTPYYTDSNMIVDAIINNTPAEADICFNHVWSFGSHAYNNILLNVTGSDYCSPFWGGGYFNWYRKWYADFNVTNATSVISNAGVNLTNFMGLVHNNLTNSSGLLRLNVTDHYSASSVWTSYNNYTLYVSKANLMPYSEIVNLSDNRMFNITLLYDNITPLVNLNFPIPDDVTGARNITFNWTAYDTTNSLKCNLTIDSLVNQSNLLVSSGQPKTVNVSLLDYGNHLWNVTCSDEAGNKNTSETRGFYVSNATPIITLNYPSNVRFNNTNLISFIFDVNHTTDLVSCALYVDNTVYKTNYSSARTVNQTITTVVSNGSHDWKIECSDAYDHLGTSGYAFFNVSANLSISKNFDPYIIYEYNLTNFSIFGHANVSGFEDAIYAPIGIYLNGSLLNITSRNWWNYSWSNRIPINLTSTISPNLNYSMILVNLSTAKLISEGLMRSDCGDMRFADINKNELNFSLETSTCGSNNTVFWVSTNLSGNSNTTIYAYIGNNVTALKTSYKSSDPTLLLNYHFDNSSSYGETSTKFYDFSKGGNNGSCSGLYCPNYTRNGSFGGAMNFNATEYIQIPGVVISNTGSTVSFWANLNNYLKSQGIFSSASGGSYSSYIVIHDRDANSVISVESRDAASNGRTISTTIPVAYARNSWHQYTLVYTSSNISLFIDGLYRGYTSQQLANLTPTYIGAGYSTGEVTGGRLNGSLDEVRIYNRSMNYDEIRLLYNLTYPYFYLNESYLQTDLNGNYNYSFSNNLSNGTYPLLINSTYRGIYTVNTSNLYVLPRTLIVNITYPVNNTTYANVSNINYTLSIPVGYCWYSNNSGQTNSTAVSYGTNFTNVISVDGSNTFTVYCNNTLGIENFSTVTFNRDISAPVISDVVTINDSGVVGGIVKRGSNLVINATVSGATYVWVKVWQGAVGISAVVWQGFLNIVSGDLWSVTIPTNWTWSLGQANYTIYANDTVGNLANFSSNFTVAESANISECRVLDSANSVYLQTANIVPTAGITSCINITASNITYDCNGKWISNTSSNIAGIYAGNNLLNITIKNCNVTMSASGYGVRFNLVNNSNLINNTFNSNNYGIYISTGSNNNLSNNIINSNSIGISLPTSFGTRIINLSESLNSGGAIELTGSNSNYLQNIYINMGGSYGGISGSFNSTFTNVTLVNTEDDAIMDLENCTFYNLTITGADSASDGILYNTQNNNKFYNSNLTVTAGYSVGIASGNNNYFQGGLLSGTSGDVILSGTSKNNTFVNTTFDSETVGSGGELIRKWYYQAYVNDSSGNNISNVNITAYNRTGSFDFSGLMTNSSGWTNMTTITEYVNTGSKKYYSNHFMKATNNSLSMTHGLNVSATLNKLDDVFTLNLDTTVPTVNIYSPLNGSYYNTSTPLFNVSSSEAGTGSIIPNLDDSLVSWWRMDDCNNSGDLIDYTGVNNLTNNGALQVENGKSGRGMNFSGRGDYVALPYKSNYNITRAITLSTWIKRTTGYSQLQDVFLLSRPPSWYFYDSYNSGSIQGEVFIDSTRRGARTTAVPFDGNWYLVTYTYDSDTQISSIYRNGVLSSSTQLTGLSNYLIDSSASNFNNVGSQTLGRGLVLDDMMIFNRSLTSEEILGLYNATRVSHSGINLSDGTHNITSYSQDLAGNIGNNTSTFYVDTNFPKINFTFPTPYYGETINVTTLIVNVSSNKTNGNNASSFINFDSSLISWWRMDDLNSTGGVVDYFGRNNGTNNGTAPVDNGKFGRAMSFDGVNDYVDINNSRSLNISSQISFCEWIYPNSLNSNIFLAKRDNPNYAWEMSSSGSSLLIRINSNTNLASGGTLNTNKWQHICGTYNGSLITAYINGVSVGTYSYSTPINVINTGVTIGARAKYIGAEGWFNGTIDDVLIFNRSLSPDEVLALYGNTSQRYLAVNFTAPDGNHTFKAYAQDYSGNVNFTETRQIRVSTNTPPNVTLISPLNGNSTTNRTPTFYYNGTDAEGNSLVYNINVTCIGRTDNINDYQYKLRNYTLSRELKYLYDNGYYYQWSVQACENTTVELYCSNWTLPWTINLSALVEISLPNDNVNFGLMNPGDSRNTTNASLSPLVIKNTGNCVVNVSMNSTDLWNSVSSPSDYFMSKIRSYTGNASSANTSWFQLPPITGAVLAVDRFNYTTTNNSLQVDVLVEVPSQEEPGNKSSQINFKASLAE